MEWSNTYIGEAAAICVKVAADVGLSVAYLVLVASALCSLPGPYFNLSTSGKSNADGTVATFVVQIQPAPLLLNANTDPGSLAIAQQALAAELALLKSV